MSGFFGVGGCEAGATVRLASHSSSCFIPSQSEGASSSSSSSLGWLSQHFPKHSINNQDWPSPESCHVQARFKRGRVFLQVFLKWFSSSLPSSPSPELTCFMGPITHISKPIEEEQQQFQWSLFLRPGGAALCRFTAAPPDVC